MWSVATKSLVITYGHRRVDAVAAMPDGQRILSGSRRVPSGCGCSTVPSRTPELHAGYGARRRALRDNQRTLRLGRQYRQALQRQQRRRPRTFTHHTGPVNSLALLPDTDGLRFVSGSDDRFARIAEIW